MARNNILLQEINVIYRTTDIMFLSKREKPVFSCPKGGTNEEVSKNG
jgi:hypothetical protein